MAILDHPTIEFLRRNHRGRRRLVEIKAPFWCGGSFFIKRKTWASRLARGLERLFGFQAPVDLGSRLEAFGFSGAEARRLSANRELIQSLETLVVDYGLSVRTDKWGLVIFGNAAKTRRLGQDPALIAAEKAARELDSMKLAGSKRMDSFDAATRWLAIPACLGAFASLALIDANPFRLLAFGPLLAPALLMAPALMALVAGVPAWFLRRSPFALPALRRSWLGVAFASAVMGLGVAQEVNAWAPRQEMILHFSGRLGHSTNPKQARYYVEPSEPIHLAQLDLDIRRIQIGRKLRDELRGPAGEDAGVFDVVIDQGVLGAPYVAQITRENPPEAEP